jgi:hypothetical protein
MVTVVAFDGHRGGPGWAYVSPLLSLSSISPSLKETIHEQPD